jgi:heme exporter protein C
MRMGGPTIHPAILTPLLVMAAAYTVLFLWLHLKAMRAEILRRRVETMMMTRVSRAASLKAAE